MSSMSSNNWLQNLRSALTPSRDQRNRQRRGSLRARAHRPRLEVLEDRCLPAFLAPVDYPGGAADVTGDFNGDSVVDLAAAGYGAVIVLLGNPDGTFEPAQTSASDPNAQSVAVGDFNGDGHLDLVTANYDYYLTGDDVSIMLGNGDGTFQPAAAVSNSINSPAWAIATGDLDGDHNLDLVVTSNDFGGFGGSHVTVLLGRGDGTFTLAASYGPIRHNSFYSVDLYAPVFADFNGDGNADVAVPLGTAQNGLVKVFLGNGDGTLQQPRDVVTHTHTYWAASYSVTVGDFDGDGRLDMATGNDNNSVGVFLGNGDGTFQAAPSIAAAYNPTTGDVNGDGVLDLVVTNAAGLSVLLGNGDGSFASPITAAAGSIFTSVVLADFNGDGRLDAAAPSADAATVSVLLNDGDWSSPPPSVSVSDAMVTEGNTGAVNATFTLTLSRASNVDVTVHFTTADISAAAGSDYTAASGDVMIPAGQTSRTFTVPVTGDRLAEPNETFAVNLSAPTNATIGDGQGIVTILDNEPRISISDVTKKEGNGKKTTLFTFTVTLSAAYDQAVTMSYRTVGGTATTSNNDYIARTDTLTFAPGETTKTITIEVKGDSKKEANETFYLDLFDGSSNSLFTKNRGIGTILNDD